NGYLVAEPIIVMGIVGVAEFNFRSQAGSVPFIDIKCAIVIIAWTDPIAWGANYQISSCHIYTPSIPIIIRCRATGNFLKKSPDICRRISLINEYCPFAITQACLVFIPVPGAYRDQVSAYRNC